MDNICDDILVDIDDSQSECYHDYGCELYPEEECNLLTNKCEIAEWVLWGCDHEYCQPGSMLTCSPIGYGICTCSTPNNAPSIDNCGRCQSPSSQDILDGGCGCCVPVCPSTCGSHLACPNTDCILSGGNLIDCCIESGHICEVNEIYGCMDEMAINYDITATLDDDTCEYSDDIIFGCTDIYASNFLTQPVCNIAFPQGCGGECNIECPNTLLQGDCEYDGYVEPSIDRVWEFIIGDELIDGNIYSQMNNFISNECDQYKCDNPLPPIGDIVNLYYGTIRLQNTVYSDNPDDMIFAFINNELRGSSSVKKTKNKSYVYLEVKWKRYFESNLDIHFYVYVNGEFYSISGIIEFGDDIIKEQPSEVTSDFGLV